MSKIRTAAVVLAAGQGKRMNSAIPKQYLLIQEKPVLYFSLKAFEESEIDEIVLVVGQGETQYCKEQFVEKYGFRKIVNIVEGGNERYHSVYYGLCILEHIDYVLIHDGARPFIDTFLIHRIVDQVRNYKACVVGMPVKDTIKIVDEYGIVNETPPRDKVWMIQTPQAFAYKLIREAYDKLMEQSSIVVTDDAMVLEQMSSHPVKLIVGSYQNIKITTPEDIKIANMYLAEVNEY